MVAFLILSYASNLNKSKKVAEQLNVIRQIYAYSGEEQGAYNKAYTDLRRKNKQLMTASVENNNSLELTKTYADKVSNYKIYGNSVQNGTPTPTNSVEIQSVGNVSKNIFNYQNILELNSSNDSTLKVVKYQGKNCLSWVQGENTEKQVFLKGTFKKNTPYYLSGYIATTTTSPGNLRVFYTDGTSDNINKFRVDTTKVEANSFFKISLCIGSSEKTIDYIRGNWNSGQTIYLDLDTIQLEEGSIETDYEPYGVCKIPIKLTNEKRESTTINILLDEPLRSLKSIQDGKVYSDYIDFKTKKIVRVVNEKVFNGDEEGWRDYSSWASSITQKTMGIAYRDGEELGEYQAPTFIDKTALCSHFIQTTLGVHTANDSLVGYFNVHPEAWPPYFGFKIPYTTLEAWRKYLREQYNINNPVKLYYALITPIEQTIELPELSTFEDYTKIEILTKTKPLKIEVEYTGYTLD